MKNPLLQLHDYGQSIWLDHISRHFITSGDLDKLIREDGLRGVTSNPTIFEKAISGSDDYGGSLRALSRKGKTADEIVHAIFYEDILKRLRSVLSPLRTCKGTGRIRKP